MKNYSSLVLRVGLALVFMWFGWSQLFDQSKWLSLIPSWAVSVSGMSASTLVVVNGGFEIIAAILLSAGLWIRPVTFLLFIHLGMIVGDVGLTAVGVRDIGLMLATLSVFLRGADEYSFDQAKSLVSTATIQPSI